MVAFKRFFCNPKLNHERLHLAKIALEGNTINGGNDVMLSKRYFDDTSINLFSEEMLFL